MTTRMQKALDRAHHEASWRVRSNFWTYAQILETVAFTVRDYFNYTGPGAEEEEEEEEEEDAKRQMSSDEAQRIAVRVVREEWNKRVREQESWTDGEETTAEKMGRVFAELKRQHGILTGMNVGCCQTCGIAELSGEREGKEVKGQGYVFWHEQSTEVMMVGGDLVLHFGNYGRGAERSREVAGVVVGRLRDAGFEVKWNGSERTVIKVENLVWRDRLRGGLIPEGEVEGEVDV